MELIAEEAHLKQYTKDIDSLFYLDSQFLISDGKISSLLIVILVVIKTVQVNRNKTENRKCFMCGIVGL